MLIFEYKYVILITEQTFEKSIKKETGYGDYTEYDYFREVEDID